MTMGKKWLMPVISAIAIRPVSRGKGVHYFLCDRAGDAAVIDFIDHMCDIDSDDVEFGEFSYAHNRRRVESFFRMHPLERKETEARMDRIARYPDSFVCR